MLIPKKIKLFSLIFLKTLKLADTNKRFYESGNKASLETKGAITHATETNAAFQDNLISQSKEIYEVLTNPIDARIGEISLENFLEKVNLQKSTIALKCHIHLMMKHIDRML